MDPTLSAIVPIVVMVIGAFVLSIGLFRNASMRKRHYRHNPRARVVSEGDLHVSGQGALTIEEPLRRSRALLVHSVEAVDVYFNDEPSVPACNPQPHCPDELDWELVERHNHRDRNGGELFLKITWKVNASRHIGWKIYEID